MSRLRPASPSPDRPTPMSAMVVGSGTSDTSDETMMRKGAACTKKKASVTSWSEPVSGMQGKNSAGHSPAAGSVSELKTKNVTLPEGARFMESDTTAAEPGGVSGSVSTTCGTSGLEAIG